MDEALLVATTFVASTLTGMIGVGGGSLLISIMPGLVPLPAIIPIHGVVQLASNVSRVGFGRKHLEWSIVRPFLGGAVAGAVLGGAVVRQVSHEWLPLLVGLFILSVTWMPGRWRAVHIPGGFAGLGAFEVFLSLFVGGIGPLNAAVLMREDLGRDRTVVTQAALAGAAHLAKIATFGVLGFAFTQWLPLILAMVVAATLGSWAGTSARGIVPEAHFETAFRATLTILAVRLVVRWAMSGSGA